MDQRRYFCIVVEYPAGETIGRLIIIIDEGEDSAVQKIPLEKKNKNPIKKSDLKNGNKRRY
jgi:hypothetical protein